MMNYERGFFSWKRGKRFEIRDFFNKVEHYGTIKPPRGGAGRRAADMISERQQRIEGDGEGGEGDHYDFNNAVDAHGCVHVGGGELAVVVADIGLVEEFAEVVVGTSEAAAQDAGKGSFGVTAVGRGMAAAITTDESEKSPLPSPPGGGVQVLCDASGNARPPSGGTGGG